MLRLSSKITIGEDLDEPIIFDFVNEIEIEESPDNLTDTAKVTIPQNVSKDGKPLAIGNTSLFKRGMKIKIECGYDDVLKVLFRGYISRVHLSLPVVLDCEDEMYILKKNTLANKSYSSVSLKTLLAYIMPSTVDYTTDGFTFENLGKVRISNNATTAQVLEMLRKNYQINSFFRDGRLFIGVKYHEVLSSLKTFGFNENIIDDKSLEWTDTNDVKVKVKGTSIQSDNTKVEYTYPSTDAEGEQATYSCPNLSLTDLKAAVKRMYDSFHYTGYKGSFLTFGEPVVKHGDKIQFTDEKIPEREAGKYIVRSVKRTFGQGGYRQTIELNNQIST